MRLGPQDSNPLDKRLPRRNIVYIYSFQCIMNPVIYIPQSKRRLEQLCDAFRYKHYGRKTEQAYCYWVRFFVRTPR